MKNFLLTLLLLSFSIYGLAKNPQKHITVSDTTVYTVVDKMPEFPGGKEAMMLFIKNNIRYPDVYQESNIQGRVLISCIVEKKGILSNIQIARGIDGPLDMEAVRVISIMPKWSPGILRGKKVRVRITIPVNFKLE
ncbi:energy transducer TonB [Paludibacter sp.]|uniref:energy transducer TonB n=1 Tax=Paludibacter sp. TaxID=1898105 RepID=UPI0013542B7B|nr:energy transducer TonB [Paludibacter sp.]MTK54377.1 energy transducer TonB [Paludibacter sp.]